MAKRPIKTSVNLSPDTIEVLKGIAQQSGGTMADVIRRAISNEKFFRDAVASGGKVLIEEPNKTYKQVLFR